MSINILATEEQHELTYRHAITEIVSKNGWDLKSLSSEAPSLVIFLRHLNCIYCRESLAELKRLRTQIEAEGVKIAVVHMGTESQAEDLLSLFGLSNVERFSDPERRLYRAFGLECTSLGQLLAPTSWMGMVRAGLKSQFIFGKKLKGMVGNVLQMPGVFLLSDGNIVGDFKPQRADKRPNYLELAAMKC